MLVVVRDEAEIDWLIKEISMQNSTEQAHQLNVLNICDANHQMCTQLNVCLGTLPVYLQG